MPTAKMRASKNAAKIKPSRHATTLGDDDSMISPARAHKPLEDKYELLIHATTQRLTIRAFGLSSLLLR